MENPVFLDFKVSPSFVDVNGAIEKICNGNDYFTVILSEEYWNKYGRLLTAIPLLSVETRILFKRLHDTGGMSVKTDCLIAIDRDRLQDWRLINASMKKDFLIIQKSICDHQLKTERDQYILPN